MCKTVQLVPCSVIYSFHNLSWPVATIWNQLLVVVGNRTIFAFANTQKYKSRIQQTGWLGGCRALHTPLIDHRRLPNMQFWFSARQEWAPNFYSPESMCWCFYVCWLAKGRTISQTMISFVFIVEKFVERKFSLGHISSQIPMHFATISFAPFRISFYATE